MTETRAHFGSKIGVILATAGSAVGLGNIWRFPYMAGEARLTATGNYLCNKDRLIYN